jgi:hypothetical protein
MSERRELYRSPNGDTWFLGREPGDGHASSFTSPMLPPGGDYLTSNWASSCAAEAGRNSRHYCA